MTDHTEYRPAWDEERAQELIGARVLIGLTHVGQQRTWQEQMFGTIASANASRGFEVKLEGKREGETFWIPPSLDAFQPAPRGEYRLKSTQEIVVDPDYTSTWTVNEPPTKQ